MQSKNRTTITDYESRLIQASQVLKRIQGEMSRVGSGKHSQLVIWRPTVRRQTTSVNAARLCKTVKAYLLEYFGKAPSTVIHSFSTDSVENQAREFLQEK